MKENFIYEMAEIIRCDVNNLSIVDGQEDSSLRSSWRIKKKCLFNEILSE